MYLLDTDTCIRFLRGDPSVLTNVCGQKRGDIHVSILTVYELKLGLCKATVQIEKKRRAVEKMLELFTLAEFGMTEAAEAAKIRAELEKAGTPIGAIDYLIAGIARANAWTLVTGNLNEFRRVKRLRAEKWHV